MSTKKYKLYMNLKLLNFFQINKVVDPSYWEGGVLCKKTIINSKKSHNIVIAYHLESQQISWSFLGIYKHHIRRFKGWDFLEDYFNKLEKLFKYEININRHVLIRHSLKPQIVVRLIWWAIPWVYLKAIVSHEKVYLFESWSHFHMCSHHFSYFFIPKSKTFCLVFTTPMKQ